MLVAAPKPPAQINKSFLVLFYKKELLSFLLLVRCVYTALTGGYETLNEQPAARDSALPFICFTDDPALASETWQIRPLHAAFAGDSIRSQRAAKLLAHRLLPDFSASLYIDNSVLLRVPPEQIFNAVDLSPGIALPEHSFRATVLDEFVEVAAGGLDDPARVAEQLRHYQAAHAEVLATKPFWAGIMLRDHAHPLVASAMELWLAHVYRYSRRDQLSCRVAFAEAGLAPAALHIDNYESWFHSWPHAAGRKTEHRLWREDAPDAIAARLLALETEAALATAQTAALSDRLAQLTREHDILLRSTSWRATAPLRALIDRTRRRLTST